MWEKSVNAAGGCCPTMSDFVSTATSAADMANHQGDSTQVGRELASETGTAAAEVPLELRGQRVAVDLAEDLGGVHLGVAAFLQ